jgi:hypothetical protein
MCRRIEKQLKAERQLKEAVLSQTTTKGGIMARKKKERPKMVNARTGEVYEFVTIREKNEDGSVDVETFWMPMSSSRELGEWCVWDKTGGYTPWLVRMGV